MKLSNKVSVRQYWLLGVWGFFVAWFVFVFLFFFVRCPPVSFPFARAETEGGEVEKF